MKITRRGLLATPMAASAATALAGQNAGGKLNIIHIGVDTWGAHYLGCYGNSEIRTPNVDGLAKKAVVFEEAFPEVLPTLPARRSIYTGRRIFPSDLVLQRDDQVKIRGWHPLFTEDVTMSDTLKSAGYTTAIISDIYHQFKPDKNFHRGFDSWRWIRGHEGDRLETGPRSAINLNDYSHPAYPNARGNVLQYLLNRRSWKTTEDYLAARVFNEASRWLENNAGENSPFYLHIESFWPHEYWDPPEDFYRMYMKSNYKGPRLISPPGTTEKMSPVEIEHSRALYAGLVSFVDDRIGRFLRDVERMGLMKNTLIVFVADHGTMMGEQGQFHKGETRIRTQVTHVPLMIYHPRQDWAGRRVKGFVQHPDLMPTLLDLAGVPAPSRVTGESLRSLAESGSTSKRETIITGWGEHGAVRNHEWVYIGRWSPGPPFEQLYDVRKDPKELKNVVEQHPTVVAEFRARLKDHVNSGWTITRGTFATKLA
jgi:arylsulfatase A-like enzyme